MRNLYIFLLLAGSMNSVYAMNHRGFADNETLDIELSKTNYNRILIEGDKIDKVRCPENTLAIDYAEDGSAYVDLLVNQELTVFLTTKAGHNFSMTVKPVESLGQTIEFFAKTPIKVAHKFENRTPPDETVTKLIQSMMNNKTPLGYGVKPIFSTYKPINSELTFKISKQFIGDAYLGEVISIYNRSKKPIDLNESIFKNNAIRAFSASQLTIAPKKVETVYLVTERANA